MSYILDALRKADSDRERGNVPGIHTQAAQAVAADERVAGSAGPLVWAVLVLSAIVVALLAWLLFGRDKAAEPSPSPAIAAAQPPVTASTPPAVPAPQVPPVATRAALPAPALAPAPAPAPALAPAPEGRATTTAAHAPRPVAPRAASSATLTKPAATLAAKPPAPAASAAVRIYATSELPDNIRRELPQVSVGGSIYSENASNRFLIINGQVFHEGDKLAADLWLDQIRLKAAVLRYKDYRYLIRF